MIQIFYNAPLSIDDIRQGKTDGKVKPRYLAARRHGNSTSGPADSAARNGHAIPAGVGMDGSLNRRWNA
jgi:hypothetical protein